MSYVPNVSFEFEFEIRLGIVPVSPDVRSGKSIVQGAKDAIPNVNRKWAGPMAKMAPVQVKGKNRL
jgi:hypothetical protein